jgi:hypothetical protein
MACGGGEFLPVKYILSVIVNHISHTGVPQAAGLTYALHAALCLPGCVGEAPLWDMDWKTGRQ